MARDKAMNERRAEERSREEVWGAAGATTAGNTSNTSMCFRHPAKSTHVLSPVLTIHFACAAFLH